MTGTRAGRLAATLLGVAALAAGCTKAQLQGDSSSYLIIDSLVSASNDALAIVNSNVSTITPDDAKVTFELALRNGGPADVPTSPTQVNSVTVTRYHVDFARSDGRNQQGVDVPYSFDGAITTTVGHVSTPVVFTLVREQAKQEAPLSAVGTAGSPLSTIAKVTFYGADQAGRDVSVAGQISVNFTGRSGSGS